MGLSASEMEKGAVVAKMFILDRNGTPVKRHDNPKLGYITKIVYDDGTEAGTEYAAGAPIKELWVRYEEGVDEKAKNAELALHRRADQATQFELRKEANNGLVQDARGVNPKKDALNLVNAKHINPNKVK